MVEAELARVLSYLTGHRPTERTLASARGFVDAMVAMEPALPGVGVEAVTLGGVPAERLTPEGADLSRTFLYLHGGGYSLGSAAGYRPFTSRLARAFGGVTFALDYRRAPEHPFPSAIEDCLAACRSLLADAAGGPGHVVLGGDSAGGGLALAAMLTLRDAGEPLPAAAALLSPWVDLEGTGESMTTRAALDPIVSREGMQALAFLYLGSRDRKDPLASPTYANLAGLPPMLVQVGTREAELDDVTLFAEKLRAAHVEVELEVWEEMLHVFQMFPVLSDAGRAIDRIAQFLRSKVR
jgi:monoterpene epsilon-lactone hydrolase